MHHFGNYSRPHAGMDGVSNMAAQATPIGWTALQGKTGETDVVLVDGLVNQGHTNIGIFVQATGKAKLEFTLASAGAVTGNSPDVVWGNTLELSDTQIHPLDLVFTAVKVTLESDGTVYFGVL